MTVTSSGYEREKNDLYETPEWVTAAAMRQVGIIKGERTWDPCCGKRKMSNFLKEHGANILASDLYKYNSGSRDFEHDFLSDKMPNGWWGPDKPVQSIWMNPPYGTQNRMAVQFIEKALEWTEKAQGMVVAVVTAKIDFGSSRQHLFGNNPNFYMEIVLTDRIHWFEPSIDKCDDKGNLPTPTEDHKILIWKWGNQDQPIKVFEGMDDVSRAELKAAKATVKAEFLANRKAQVDA